MGITQEELATHLNLHRSSVARILGGKGKNYSKQTQERVLKAATELGYQPNPTARALATGLSHIAALWVQDYEDYSPYYSYVHHCLQRLGIQYGYQLLTEDVSRATLSSGGTNWVRWPVDGVLSCDRIDLANEYLLSGREQNCPIVCLGVGDTQEMDCVTVDFYSGAKEAVSHLLSADCQRVGFVSAIVDFEPRARAYQELMGQAAKKVEYVLATDSSRLAGYRAMRQYIAVTNPPDGLFCFNDEMAIGCYLALAEAGIRVPEDVLLVGFDGLDNAKLFPCPVSSVVVPVEEMCRIAWDMLQVRLKDPRGPLQHCVLETHLEVRASSDRCPRTREAQRNLS